MNEKHEREKFVFLFPFQRWTYLTEPSLLCDYIISIKRSIEWQLLWTPNKPDFQAILSDFFHFCFSFTFFTFACHFTFQIRHKRNELSNYSLFLFFLFMILFWFKLNVAHRELAFFITKYLCLYRLSQFFSCFCCAHSFLWKRFSLISPSAK